MPGRLACSFVHHVGKEASSLLPATYSAMAMLASLPDEMITPRNRVERHGGALLDEHAALRLPGLQRSAPGPQA